MLFAGVLKISAATENGKVNELGLKGMQESWSRDPDLNRRLGFWHSFGTGDAPALRSPSGTSLFRIMLELEEPYLALVLLVAVRWFFVGASSYGRCGIGLEVAQTHV